MDLHAKTKIHNITIWLMIGIILFLSGYVLYLNKKTTTDIENIETLVTQKEDKYIQFYYEREFKKLRNENQALYDSLKTQQDYITSLEQFSYRVKYSTDTVFIESKLDEIVQELPDETFDYQMDSDTLSYNLLINSKVEPNWYKLDVEVKDEFTIVNKAFADGSMNTVIESKNKGEISDITAWQISNRRKWYQRFSLGPSVTVGYDPINKNFGAMIGISLTYDLLGK